MIIRGGLVALPSGLTTADVVIGDDGRITAVVDAGGAPPLGESIDATGLLVLPGMVDAHVHLDEPGRAGWEGFDTGSAAAAAGGVTTVVDMPIDCDPPTVDAAAVRAKAAAARTSRVDVAMWGGLVPDSVPALGAMIDAGVVGFKAFACPSGWADFPPADDATLAAGMKAAAAAGVPVAVHCELESLGHTERSEVAAVRWAAEIATASGAALHVVHVSSAGAVDEARRWPGVTVETCPHYLFLDEVEAAAIGNRARCFPPIRGEANCDRLWDRLRDGSIDCVASDHSPCPPSRREGPAPWAGVDGLGLGLPMLLSDGRLGVERVVELTTAAARVLRLPGKGAIAAGFDADLVLVDRASQWTIAPGTLWSRHRASPFIGRSLHARVERTLVRGRTVYTADEGPAEAGGGRVITPGPLVGRRITGAARPTRRRQARDR